MIIACINNTIVIQIYDLVLFPGIYKATPPIFITFRGVMLVTTVAYCVLSLFICYSDR